MHSLPCSGVVSQSRQSKSKERARARTHSHTYITCVVESIREEGEIHGTPERYAKPNRKPAQAPHERALSGEYCSQILRRTYFSFGIYTTWSHTAEARLDVVVGLFCFWQFARGFGLCVLCRVVCGCRKARAQGLSSSSRGGGVVAASAFCHQPSYHHTNDDVKAREQGKPESHNQPTHPKLGKALLKDMYDASARPRLPGVSGSNAVPVCLFECFYSHCY